MPYTRIDGLEVFCSYYQFTVTCLESICNDGPRLWTSNSVTDAITLQLAITTTDFLSTLVMTNFCLKYLQALTSNVQAETKDIVVAVNYVITTLQNVIETYRSQWFTVVEKMCADVGTVPAIPQRCSHQMN